MTTRPGSGSRRSGGPLPLVLVGLGLLLAAYLLLSLGVPDRPVTGDDGCYDRVVYHAARLTDC